MARTLTRPDAGTHRRPDAPAARPPRRDDVVVVSGGKPARLNFRPEETAGCSEVVLLPGFQKSAQLPQGQVLPVEFLPMELGEYQFACQMGMLRGKLVVE
jgi:plastocyanin domain-containing protein